MVVLPCEEKIDSEDGQRNGFERGEVFFFFFLLGFYVLLGFSEKKIKTDFFFFLNNADVENCGTSKSFGFIYIYRCGIFNI